MTGIPLLNVRFSLVNQVNSMYSVLRKTNTCLNEIITNIVECLKPSDASRVSVHKFHNDRYSIAECTFFISESSEFSVFCT